MRWLASLACTLVASSLALGGEFGGKSTEEWIKLLKTSKEVKTRSAALIALEVIGTGKGLVDAVLEAVMTDAEAPVRRQAALVLGRLNVEPSRVAPVLGEVLAKDKEGTVREGAAKALGSRLTDPKVLEQVKLQTLVLARALKDAHVPTRTSAAETLKNLREHAREALPNLLELIALAENEDVARRFAIQAVSRFAMLDGKDLESVVATLSQVSREKGASVGVREAALDGLAFLKNDTAVPALIEGLGARDHVELRRTAARGLAQLKEKATPAIATLVVAVTDDDDFVRVQAIIACGHLGKANAAAVKALIEAAEKDRNLDNRVTAIQALGELGKAAASAVTPLETMATNDVRARIREAARDAAKRIKGS